MDVAQAETGKARSAAQEEIVDILLNARYYARTAPRLLASQRAQGLLPGVTKTTVHHVPKGVVGVISPWNYPMMLAVSDALPALLAGNAVVVKPDSQTPYCALAAPTCCTRRACRARCSRSSPARAPRSAPRSSSNSTT